LQQKRSKLLKGNRSNAGDMLRQHSFEFTDVDRWERFSLLSSQSGGTSKERREQKEKRIAEVKTQLKPEVV
jgi:hypothetical protein